MSRRLLTALVVTGSVLAAVAVLAACSGSTDDGASTSAAPASSAPAAPSPTARASAPKGPGHRSGTWTAVVDGTRISVQLPARGTDADALRTYLRRAGGRVAGRTVARVTVDNRRSTVIATAGSIAVVTRSGTRSVSDTVVTTMNSLAETTPDVYSAYLRTALAKRLIANQYGSADPGTTTSTLVVLDVDRSSGISVVTAGETTLRYAG